MGFAEFYGKIKKEYRNNELIFSSELLKMFNYSKMQISRYINKAEKECNFKKYSDGIYFFGDENSLGFTTVCADDVAKKKYINNRNDVFGVYSGVKLLNMFGITSQMPSTIEIVSNNESSRYRMIEISKRKFIVKKSKCKITKDNYKIYMIFELFNQLSDSDLTNDLYIKISNYIEKENIEMSKLREVGINFPSKTVKRFYASGITDGTLRR